MSQTFDASYLKESCHTFKHHTAHLNHLYYGTHLKMVWHARFMSHIERSHVTQTYVVQIDTLQAELRSRHLVWFCCCRVLQCVAMCCSVLQCVAECCNVLQGVAERCRVLQCVAMCCSVLQCVVVCRSVL